MSQHAFRGRNDGEVTISLQTVGGRICLRLLQMLARQLDGAVEERDEWVSKISLGAR